MKWIGSGMTHYRIGVYLGIAITVISLLGSARYPFFQPLFDWMIVFFIGIAIFFFFMAIWFNTEENTNVSTDENASDGKRREKTVTSFLIDLDRFKSNPLSKSCFVISIIFGMLAGFRFSGVRIS